MKYYIQIYYCKITVFHCNIFQNVIYDGKAEFSEVITPVFIVTWSFRNYNCWFGSQETFLVIINTKNSCAASYFMETYSNTLQ